MVGRVSKPGGQPYKHIKNNVPVREGKHKPFRTFYADYSIINDPTYSSKSKESIRKGKHESSRIFYTKYSIMNEPTYSSKGINTQG